MIRRKIISLLLLAHSTSLIQAIPVYPIVGYHKRSLQPTKHLCLHRHFLTTSSMSQPPTSVQGFYQLGCKLQLVSFQIGHFNVPDKWLDRHRLRRGDYQGLDFPIVYEYLQGRKLRDVLEDGGGGLAVISDCFKQVLIDYGLTGWQTYPVEIYDKNIQLVPGYHGFSVLGRCGPVDKKASSIIQKRYVTHGPLVEVCKGVYPDMTQWDGSDFFVPTDHVYMFISPKAYKVLKKEKITNLRFEHLPDAERDKSVWHSGRSWGPLWNPPPKGKVGV